MHAERLGASACHQVNDNVPCRRNRTFCMYPSVHWRGKWVNARLQDKDRAYPNNVNDKVVPLPLDVERTEADSVKDNPGHTLAASERDEYGHGDHLVRVHGLAPMSTTRTRRTKPERYLDLSHG
jgi:hypothetical protein